MRDILLSLLPVLPLLFAFGAAIWQLRKSKTDKNFIKAKDNLEANLKTLKQVINAHYEIIPHLPQMPPRMQARFQYLEQEILAQGFERLLYLQDVIRASDDLTFESVYVSSDKRICITIYATRGPNISAFAKGQGVEWLTVHCNTDFPGGIHVSLEEERGGGGSTNQLPSQFIVFTYDSGLTVPQILERYDNILMALPWDISQAAAYGSPQFYMEQKRLMHSVITEPMKDTVESVQSSLEIFKKRF